MDVEKRWSARSVFRVLYEFDGVCPCGVGTFAPEKRAIRSRLFACQVEQLLYENRIICYGHPMVQCRHSRQGRCAVAGP